MPNPKINVFQHDRRAGSSCAPTVLTALLVALGASAPPGCAQKSDESAQTSTEASENIRRDLYVVRGEVRRVPIAGEPAAEFVVHHEAIPHYRASEGRLGMNVMSMPFPLAPGLSLEGVSIGDKVEVTFEVEFDTEKDQPVAYRATKVELLPSETELNFTPLPRPEPPAE